MKLSRRFARTALVALGLILGASAWSRLTSGLAPAKRAFSVLTDPYWRCADVIAGVELEISV
jgi:hypothetical protein